MQAPAIVVTMKTIVKSDFVKRILAAYPDMSLKQCKEMVEFILNQLVSELNAGNRIEFRGFGVFESQRKKARIAHNPRTAEKVHVPAKMGVKFKPGKLMNPVAESGGDEDTIPRHI